MTVVTQLLKLIPELEKALRDQARRQEKERKRVPPPPLPPKEHWSLYV